jgi:beta-galactosidase
VTNSTRECEDRRQDRRRYEGDSMTRRGLLGRADNSPQPSSRWYTGSGIYRHTWLVAVNPVHVAQWGTFVALSRVSTTRPKSL